MTLKQMRYVIAIARYASISEAAKKLYLTQPSLTSSIHQLETELGFPIFLRSRGGVEVTPKGQDLIQHIRLVMEGDTQMLDFPLSQEFQRGLISPALLVLGENVLILGVHQVEVKILYTAGFQLLFQQGADIFLIFKEVGRQFVGQDILVTGISGSEAFSNGQFTFAVDVAMSGIKIIETIF